MPDRRTLDVQCPCCQAGLVVDAETGDVLMHKEAKKAVELDLGKAVRALKDDKGRREEEFQKSLEAQKRKGSRIDKQFEEGLRRAQENPGAPPPPREIDLD